VGAEDGSVHVLVTQRPANAPFRTSFRRAALLPDLERLTFPF
jgi:hypothetical protein